VIIGIKINRQASKEDSDHYGGCFNFLLIQLKNLLIVKKKKKEKGKETAEK
jgi:hypothetical protein